MRRRASTLAVLAAALLLAPSPASARRKKAVFVDMKRESGASIGMKEPQEELAEIMRKIERGELPKIQFEFDSEDILLESRPTLDAVADLLFRNPKLKLMVLAHTCTMGSEEYNLDLSERRAKSVKTYLVRQGIPPPTIRYRGLGFSAPIADNSTEEGRSKNRRVEFRVTFRDWEAVY